ncbi:MAG: NADH-quinone oxidoreductase subunit NuoE [Desulfuromonadales bacterium]|nr:NADH-quinone oxidoreductase subunit NuoE [Desulfuromonadales bacterium]NIS41961.1 NADH-quinone oxidoreductase subunit NuoE [Desulfuromonadales bacterium]
MSDVAENVAEEEIDLTGAHQVIDKYIDMKGALMPVLQEIQDHYGYIPEPTVHLVAERLNVYASQIYGVLTFYAQFHLEPRGKFIVRICMGTACHVKGAGRIANALEEKLGIGHAETTEDLNFTAEHVACLGACGMAPVVMVNDDTFGSVSVQQMGDIVEQYKAQT